MKKIMIIAFAIAGITMAQQYAGQAPIALFDNTDGSVTYIGTAYTEASGAGTVSTNDAKWNIVKITKTGGVATGIYVACTTNRGDQSMWKTAWANRASTNTIYKTAE